MNTPNQRFEQAKLRYAIAVKNYLCGYMMQKHEPQRLELPSFGPDRRPSLQMYVNSRRVKL